MNLSKLIYLPFLVLLWVSPKTILAQPVNVQDSLALVTLYNNTDGPNWINSTNWLAGPVSTWQGITVANERVTEINLSDNQLKGPLPEGLDSLDALQVFLVERNGLTGTIPPAFGSLLALRRLSLYANRFEGPIPETLSQLTALTQLRLGNNQLTGPIPPSLSQLVNLTSLDFGNNQLTNGIPPELGQLTKLGALFLFGNPLGGALPAELGNLTNLIFMELIRNNLTGEIPSSFGNLVNLRALSLYQNDLTGSIPPELGRLIELERLQFFDNQLSGEIPSELGNLTKLTRIWLHQNALTGTVPASFANFTNLTDLILNDNQLVDFPDLSALPALTTLRLHNNRFTFEDIEPNIGVATFEYSPQNPFDSRHIVNLSTGDTLSLHYDVGGTNNTYQWLKDGQPIPNANMATYSFPMVSPDDVGFYVVEIQNAAIPDLTLESEPVTITVDGIGVATEEGTDIPLQPRLLHNAPNPFQTRTTLSYTLPKSQHVTLTVYDVLGRQVQVLFSGWQQAGQHQAIFEAGDQPNGTYLYRLETETNHISKKMILLR